MAATDRWDLEVIGKGGHAAFPHQTVDPIHVATQIVQAWQGLVSRETRPTSPVVISTTKFHAGEAYNVIAGRAHLAGTTRTLDPVLQDRLERRMAEVASSIARAWNAEAMLSYERGYPATHNDAACAAHAAAAAAEVVGSDAVISDYPPSLGGEDFAFMLEGRPGAYLWLGQRTEKHTAPLHSSHYDFNDAVLPLGASLHVALAQSRLRA
jgi:hippurate hydrolase